MSVEYMAGLFDGEGCIGFYKHSKKQHMLQVSVEMACKPIVQMFADRYGGKVYTRNGKKHGSKQQYQFVVRCEKAEKLVKELGPLMIEKRSQAELAVEIREYQREHRRDDVARLDEYVDMMKALKR